MKKTSSKAISHGRIAENRRAKFDYTIVETLEAGIVLLGSEVKSLRLGRASIAEAYATEEEALPPAPALAPAVAPPPEQEAGVGASARRAS